HTVLSSLKRALAKPDCGFGSVVDARTRRDNGWSHRRFSSALLSARGTRSPATQSGRGGAPAWRVAQPGADGVDYALLRVGIRFPNGPGLPLVFRSPILDVRPSFPISDPVGVAERPTGRW